MVQIIVLIGCLVALGLNIWFIKVKAKLDKCPVDGFDAIWCLLFACGSWATAGVVGFLIFNTYKKLKDKRK